MIFFVNEVEKFNFQSITHFLYILNLVWDAK